MKRLTVLSIFLLLFLFPAFAQDAPATPPAKERTIPSTEISAGYTIHRFYQPDTNFGSVSPTMSGWYFDVEHNIFRRWLGAEVQASGAYKNQGASGKLSVYTAMAGPAFYPLGHRRVTLFAHVLVGEGYYRDSIPQSAADFPGQVNTSTSFTWTAGGGLDISISKHWAVRLPQVEYTSSDFFHQVHRQSDTRISFGLVYRIGEK